MADAPKEIARGTRPPSPSRPRLAVLGSVFGLILLVAARSGGLGSPALALMPALPVFALFLVGVRACWWSSLGAVLGVLALGGLQAGGWLRGPATGLTPSLAYAIILIAACGLVWVVVESYERRLVQLAAALRAASTRDSLIDVANRNSLDDALALEHHRLARYPESALAVVLFDIDHFEKYNDTYGHQAGDEVLERVAAAAQERLRRAPDVLGRYGGDQLLAVLPATDVADATVLAECIRRDIEALALDHEASPHGVVTVSLGVAAETFADDRSIDALLTDVDRALRHAKDGGRNAVATASGKPVRRTEN